jgi:tetratricopeptide (TPR) repeat protein
VTPRTRVVSIVAVLAAAAAAVTVGVAALTSDGAGADNGPKARPGAPPLALDFGVRTDAEARALREASRLLDRGRRGAAARIFAWHSSVEARIGLAFARWPDGTFRTLDELAATHPRSALVRLHLGLAQFWSGRGGDARRSWRAAVRVQPDSASAVRADDLLHPNFPRGVPVFVPTFGAPSGLVRLSPARQLAALAAAARAPRPRAKILYGIALQRLGRPLSARRQYAAAAALAPGDAEAQTAAAVGLFSKPAPARAFARLGPLTRRFPRAATVRFHLGLLLLWLGRVDEARGQLRRAAAVEPRSPLAREARRFLQRLRGVS